MNFNFIKLQSEINSISFIENFGIQDGDKIKLLFIKFLESKFNVKDITFQELYKKTNKKLTIIGTNLSLSKEECFNYKSTPDMSVILALRISMSVPIIFTPVQYNNQYYIDGGFVNNFPINYCSKKKTIGFYIKNSGDNNIDSIKSLMISLLGVAADTISEKNIKKYFKRIVQIKNTQFNYTKFDIDKNFIKNFIKIGSEAANNFNL